MSQNPDSPSRDLPRELDAPRPPSQERLDTSGVTIVSLLDVAGTRLAQAATRLRPDGHWNPSVRITAQNPPQGMTLNDARRLAQTILEACTIAEAITAERNSDSQKAA